MSATRRTDKAERASKVALFFFWASFAAIAFNIYSEVLELRLISDLEALDEAGAYYDAETIARIEANDDRQLNALFGYLAAIGSSFIVMLVWVSRVNRACHELGTENMRFTPGWAWGYWLIPFVNLVRPFQIVSELWTVTNPERRSTPLIGWWWGAWLGSGFLSRIGQRGSHEQTLEDIRRMDQWLLASHALDIVAFGLSIVIITKVTANLRRYQEHMAPAGVRVVNDSSD